MCPMPMKPSFVVMLPPIPLELRQILHELFDKRLAVLPIEKELDGHIDRHLISHEGIVGSERVGTAKGEHVGRCVDLHKLRLDSRRNDGVRPTVCPFFYAGWEKGQREG